MKRHALFVGVDQYADGHIPNLSCAVSDATDLHGFFKYGAGYDQVELLPNPAGKKEILGKVRSLTADLGPGDFFLFFFAGHGFRVGENHVLVCSNDLYDDVKYEDDGLPLGQLKRRLSGAFDSALLLDACQSDILATRGGEGIAERDLSLIHEAPTGSSGCGALTIVTSCDAGQTAAELSERRHGLFTVAMLDLLQEAQRAHARLDLSDAFRLSLGQRMGEIAARFGLPTEQSPRFSCTGNSCFILLDGVASQPSAPQTPPSYHQPSVAPNSASASVAPQGRAEVARNMKKVAIIGAEGDGKAVLLTVMGQKYIRPDAAGYFWRPLTSETAFYCMDRYVRLRKGEWPPATCIDDHCKLKWEVFKQKERSAEHVGDICISYLVGETYRGAFFGLPPYNAWLEKIEGDYLKENIAQADELLLVVDLGRIINAKRKVGSMSETDWLARQMLAYLYEKNPECRVAVVFTKIDQYAEIISTHGGLAATFEKYLPGIYYRYETQIASFAVSAVNKTVLNGEGWPVPASDFGSEGIEELFAWMINDVGREEPLERELHAGDVRTLTLPGGAEMEMIYCPPGEFLMGSPENEEGRGDDETQHHVRLTKGFWLGKYPVAQRQWQSVMGNNPSDFKGDDLPVENVSWDDCKGFIERARSSVKQQLGGEARFPTEAEWEYACRAGMTAAYYWGNALNGDKANCDGNYPCGTKTKGPYFGKTSPVGRYAPNPWGFYDIYGNVLEWCADWYGGYPTGSVTDPVGPASGVNRVLRGGGWVSCARNCRSAYRSGDDPGVRDSFSGFRLCCSAGPRG